MVGFSFIGGALQSAAALLTDPKKELKRVGLAVLTGLSIALPVSAGLITPTRLAAVGKAILPKTPKAALKAAVVIPTAVGVLGASPKAREFVKTFVDPRRTFAKGGEIGKIIEDPSKLFPKDQTTLEKVKEVTKTAGVAAGVLAAGAGLVVAGKKIKEKIITTKLPEAVLPALPSITPSTQPLGAVQPDKPLEVQSMPDIINKISVKPEINVRVSQNRKFINQQILIRS